MMGHDGLIIGIFYFHLFNPALAGHIEKIAYK